jgi:large subunit ribosomal protein L31e
MAKETTKQVTKEETEELANLSEEELDTEIVAKEQTPPQEEVVEEAKPKKKKKDEQIVEERFYTIPLSRALVRPPKKRAPRAIQLIKEFVNRHMKIAMKVTEEEEGEDLPQLIISKEVNEKVWDRGIEKPPRKIKTRITKDKDGNVTVYLAETKK